MINSILKKIPDIYKGEIVDRVEVCRMCNEDKATLIALVDYWDIKSTRIVQCPKCRLIQLDPMLTTEETAKGCLAYYIEESLRIGKHEQVKNNVRNFRRGVLFAHSLKKINAQVKDVLELGPGSGYFAEGMKFILPDLNITVLDINKELLDFNKKHHGFNIIEAIPDSYVINYDNSFDLIIARDIIEHVSDISKVVKNVNKYLRVGGLFHFTTPNGHEDAWKHYLTYSYRHEVSELLINHVNYFDGKGLKEFLAGEGFKPEQYYTFEVKSTMKGYGWKTNPSLMSPVSKKAKADYYVKDRASEAENVEYKKAEILDKWYINKKNKWITIFYSWYQHSHFFKISPDLKVGHEIFGLFRKTI